MQSFDARELPLDTENVFGLDNPAVFTCRVLLYGPENSWVAIQLTHADTQEMKVLVFYNVAYIETPITWTGANFRTANLADLSRFYFDLHNTNGQVTKAYDGPYDVLRQGGMRLYEVELHALRVRIMSNGFVGLYDYDEFIQQTEGQN